MKTSIVSLVLMSPLFLASVVQAHEGSVGNGGGAQLCFTDKSKTVEKSIESYDLYQGRKILRYNIPVWNGVELKAEILDRMIQKLKITQPEFAADIEVVLKRFEGAGIVRWSDSIQLTQVPGSIAPQLDENCVYKQMVNWYDPGQYTPHSGNIVLWDNTHYMSGPVHMDPLNQAALDFHEAAYKMARIYLREKADVAAVLEFVAAVFSDSSKLPELVPASVIRNKMLETHTKFYGEGRTAVTSVSVTDFGGCTALSRAGSSGFSVSTSGPVGGHDKVGTINHYAGNAGEVPFYSLAQFPNIYSNLQNLGAVSIRVNHPDYDKMSFLGFDEKIKEEAAESSRAPLFIRFSWCGQTVEIPLNQLENRFFISSMTSIQEELR